MELALERWFYRDAFQTLANMRPAGKVLLSAFQLDADLTNLLIALRFVQAPGEHKFLSEWLHIEKFEHLFVGPGRLSPALLHRVVSQDLMDAAVETLAGTPYKVPLQAGLRAYASSALLSEFEKQLNRFRLTWMVRQITRDPLGIGVVLGYLALKINEVNNLRWIAQGIQLGLTKSAILAELEYSA